MEITKLHDLNFDPLSLKEIIRIKNSPKNYVIIVPNKVYCTNNLARTLNTIATEYPSLKQTEITIIKKP